MTEDRQRDHVTLFDRNYTGKPQRVNFSSRGGFSRRGYRFNVWVPSRVWRVAKAMRRP